MMQPDLFNIAASATPPPRISRQNEHGVLETIEILQIKGKAGQGIEILLAFDGQEFYWSTSMQIGPLCAVGSEYHGSLPSISRRARSRQASTREQAILDAAEYARSLIARIAAGKGEFGTKACRWLDNILGVEPIAAEPWGEERAA